jgi:nicotinate-nucleotide--dimethylbenzimidazole phosphoribosyltransferase
MLSMNKAGASRVVFTGEILHGTRGRECLQLLISGDLGIGNTTPAAALVAAGLGLPASEVAGRGTGIDDAMLERKMAVIDAALARAALDR